MSRPLVLLSNDDGYRAPGVRALAARLKVDFEVVLCAPHSEQSASSHSLSLNRPLRVEDHGERVFSVDGTPADSVYVALHAEGLLPSKPCAVVSGMNHGLNLGQDVFYSGTVAAAREGALQGYPALAVSADPAADLAAACDDAVKILHALLERRTGPALFNVNYPRGSSWPHRPTTAGQRHYSGGLHERHDPRGRPYYWIGGESVSHEGEEGTDTYAFDEGVVGITPLILDLSDPREERDAAALCEAVS